MFSSKWVRLSVAACVMGLVGCSSPGDDSDSVSAASSRGRNGGGEGGGGQGGGDQSVSAHLGGYAGILSFLEDKVIPAELSDDVVAPAFTEIPLTETGADIAQCLGMLLDHQLGGDSRTNGTRLDDGHTCRSSMSNIHRGRNISDAQIDRFIQIVGEQATMAGVAASDIAEVAQTLEHFRGSVRHK